MFKTKNAKQVFVTTNTTPLVSGTVNEVSDIADGQIAAVYADGTTIDLSAVNLSAVTAPYRFVKRVGNELYYSQTINPANVKPNSSGTKTGQKTAYTAPTEQITYLGYNGANTESVEVINSNDYLVRITVKDGLKTFGDKLMYKFGAYRSDSTATAYEVANGIVTSLTKNFKREAEKMFKFMVVNSAPLAAAYDFDHTVTVVNGLPYITVATDVKYNTGTDAVVGDYVRIGATATTAVALTSNVYKITAINSTTITLDRPVEEASGSYITANSYNQVIPAASYGTYTGIKIMGVARTNFVPGTFKYYKNACGVSLDGFGSTLITLSQGASLGVGSAYEVAEQEWYGWGAWGKFHRIGTPSPTFPQTPATTYTETFDVVEISFADTSNNLITPANTPASVVIYFPASDNSYDKLFA